MTTQAIHSSANILATPVPASGSSSSSTAEIPFNQLLQREVTERRSAEQSPRQESQQAPAASNSPASAQAEKTVSEAGKEDQDKPSSEENAESGDAAAASAELLALVANMTQLASAANAQSNLQGDEKDGVQLDVDVLTGHGKLALTDTEKLQKSAHAGDGDQPIVAMQYPGAAAKAGAGKAASEGTDRMPQLETLQFSSTSGTAALADEMRLSEQRSASLDTPSVSGTNQLLAPTQSALNKLQASTTTMADALTPPVGTPAWDKAVGQKVVWMVAGAQQSASLTLNPPELGPMQIVLNVSNAQANATFVAPQAEVRQALEAALPRLREMLGDAGIQLGQASISAGTPNHGGQFEQGGKSSSSHFSHDQHDEQPIAAVRQTAVRQGLGMVDTFA